jgi:phosphoribosylformylglycinamidine synthase I
MDGIPRRGDELAMNAGIGIVQFPGVNCEYETARAVIAAGMSASIVRWNRTDVNLSEFDGFILPGGFSYEDRVRGGAIAAGENIMAQLMDEAAQGKPVVGICNGAQVLVECGLVPGSLGRTIDLALAPNRGMGRSGYYANWVYLRPGDRPERCAITCDLKPGEVLPLPIAHSQGRFASGDTGLFELLDEEGRIVLKYCRSDGGEPDGFPDDPNGSERYAAAVSNPEGNVVALMPHPERATWLRQVPVDLVGAWARMRAVAKTWREMEVAGPGFRIFQSVRRYIEERRG